MNFARGLTLVEVMLAVAVLGLLAAVSLPPVRMFQRTASLQTSAQDMQEMLRLARQRTIASEEESVYGVSFETGALPHSATLFRGPSFAERAVEADETRTFPGSVEIFDVALSTGVQEVVFERLTGDASASGTISLRLADNPDQRAFVSIAGNGNIYPGSALESIQPLPPNADSRHVNVSYLGRTIDTGSESVELVLSLGGDLVEQSIPISPALSGGQIEWSGSVEVAGKPQEIRIHTLSLNDLDTRTVFSIHRDRRVNTSSLSVSLSGDSSGTIISYEEDGTVAEGTSIYAQDPEQQ